MKEIPGNPRYFLHLDMKKTLREGTSGCSGPPYVVYSCSMDDLGRFYKPGILS